MSDAASSESTPPTTTEQIQTEIEQTRAELAQTVDQVVDKLNVKSQVGHKADSLKQAAAARASHVKASAPPPVRSALTTIGEKAGPAAKKVNDSTAPNRGKIALGVVGGVFVLLVIRRARRG